MSSSKDNRFNTDPRFKLPNKSNQKVNVDKRFNAMFKDPAFNPKANQNKLDAFGRNIKAEKAKQNHHLKKFYKLDEQEENDSDEDKTSESEVLQNSDDDSSDSSQLSGDEIDIADENEEDTEQIDMGEESRRIAIVNLTWEQIRAVDLLVLFNSFLPEGGMVERVLVYPSDYGLQKMKEEQKKGPQGIWKENREDMDEEDPFDQVKLREFELQRMRYYYAIADFDSVETSAHVYRECDGMEFMASGNLIDLRFVPDDQSFESREIRDEACKVPSNYEAPDFYSSALQHTNVDLTWDQDFHRQNLFTKKAPKGEAGDSDFKVYLASDNESDGYGSDAVVELSDPENEEGSVVLKKKARNRFKDLLSSIPGSKNGPTENDVESSGNLEIVFESGLKSIGQEILNRKKENDKRANETFFESQERKKKEKRKSKKSVNKADEGDEMYSTGLTRDEQDDEFFADAFSNDRYSDHAKSKEPVNLKRKRKTSEEIAEESRQQAELELLLMDDASRSEEVKKGYNLQELLEDSKKSKKSRKSKKSSKSGDSVDGFEVDVNDVRFSALYADSQFALDPTDANYKRTRGVETLEREILSRRADVRGSLESAVSRSRLLHGAAAPLGT
jgi:hypothetical protein